MNPIEMIEMERSLTGITGPFCAYGSFGILDGAVSDRQGIVRTEDGYRYASDQVEIACRFEQHEQGVYLRRDTLKNVSGEAIELNCYMNRFCLEGAPYTVYTQFNNWEQESMGRWQPLHTTVCAENFGLRLSEGAAPILAIKNEQNGKGCVFHLVPNARWRMSVSRRPAGGKSELVTVEMGMNERGLKLVVEPGETIEMPEIIAYEFENELDLDAWKLHRLLAKRWPKRRMPVLYNTWLLNFDRIDVEDVFRQAEAAAELGVEYFVIDAGWFGEGDDWSRAAGDWTENLTGGYRGRLRELSDFVHARGMRFGLWLEPERAFSTTNICRSHPEYFFGFGGDNMFLDFAREDAFDYILRTTLELVERFHIDYFKFDFNANMAYDPHGSGFYRYHAAHRHYVRAIRERYPDIYLTNCASGGMRMNIAGCMDFDTCWPSDHQGPHDILRILRESVLRLPPQAIERWCVLLFKEGFPQYGSSEKARRAISCNDATWGRVTSVTDSFWFGLFFGGAFGYSCDIASFPAEYRQRVAEFIARFKAEREIWQAASCRILADSGQVTALQYDNEEAGRAMLLVFTGFVRQSHCTLYPRLEGSWRTADGADAADGVRINGLRDDDCRMIELFRQ